jgi:hypothetical protein
VSLSRLVSVFTGVAGISHFQDLIRGLVRAIRSILFGRFVNGQGSLVVLWVEKQTPPASDRGCSEARSLEWSELLFDFCQGRMSRGSIGIDTNELVAGSQAES